MTNPVLKIDKLSVKRGKTQHRLVDDVSCCVEQGEILGIIGPNGAGKSTLLSAIMGDIDYTGSISIEGQSMKESTQTPHLRARQTAILPQLSLLNFPFRVFEVVKLGRIPHQTGLARDNEIIDQALDLMDIGFLKDRLYTELSGGEKQRVQLARVLAQIWSQDDSPSGKRLLILDEPTTALDLGHQQDLMNAIKTFSQQGVAVVIVLHDINLAARYCDKLLALLCSQTLAYGSVDEVVSIENVKRLFGIDAQIISHPVHNTPVVVGL